MKQKPDARAELCLELYNALIAAFRHAAERCGYAIGVHGSLRRDIDLIAAPWRDSAVSAEYLIKQLMKVAEAVEGVARIRKVDKGRLPEKKPCGRLAWSFYLTYDDNGPYIDISVMPKVSQVQNKEKQ